MIPSQNINNKDIANQGESNTYHIDTNRNNFITNNYNNRNSPLGSPTLNRRIPNPIPTQPPTQQKRHNSQSYVLNASTKRGAIFQNLNSNPNSNGTSPNHSNNLLPSTLTPNIQITSGNPSTATLANLSTTASSQQQIVNGKKLNITGLTPTSASQARQKASKTPTPSIPALEVPASPRSRAIAKVYETDMSVEGSSELNDVPHSRGANTVDNRPNSNSPESISDPKQQRGIQRRQSTETVVSQPPPPPQQQQSAQRAITEEEQILASNLQETYKSILRLEIETQQGCAEVNQKLAENDLGVEVTPQLWVVYKNVVQLLDHYYDFLLYALSPSSVRAGKPLVNNYRILRRMWVYGIVSFLEVLKNVATIVVEPEICACFISYAFNIISCLTDSQLGVEGWWAEKLGDLSRMAIALYPARYMDWKLSSIYWYQTAMKTQFGHGKIYYHVCTVESDNLEALMNIGKGVSCRDPFVPSATYLRMIVDNCCSQRNILNTIEMAMIDFVKIHKILLMPNYNSAPEMVNLVSHYATHFGMDSSNMDFFQMRFDRGSNLPVARVAFWFQKGPNFALCNIAHMIGFGDSRNPFAKLFDLPEALKERKDKKDKRRKSKSEASNDGSKTTTEPEALYNSTASDQDETSWFLLLDFINKGVLELAMRMLKQYISGPLQTSAPHVIVWLYFISAVGESVNKYPRAKPLFTYLMARYIPWMKLIPYLNDILCIKMRLSGKSGNVGVHFGLTQLT
ncbi:unnamed protein product [Ambrosiozyma monospora]|uniref:Unnamed protein product n=1 Tax=Ambrosiozyma monospora TaxID=43982 RepID=A0A9W7DIQ0_AMBMO|nr:unnamed protein product [Ambrosiozyma monospora]